MVSQPLVSRIITEPEEYALVFGLFALGFVFFHRRQMQKKRQQALASPNQNDIERMET